MDALRILIVEDERHIREALAALLLDEGYRVALAANGQEGLQFLRSHPETDLILVDLVMPGVDGWQFRREQLRDPELALIPTAALSAKDLADPRARDLPFSAYFPKPLYLRLLLDYIAQASRARRAVHYGLHVA